MSSCLSRHGALLQHLVLSQGFLLGVVQEGKHRNVPPTAAYHQSCQSPAKMYRSLDSSWLLWAPARWIRGPCGPGDHSAASSAPSKRVVHHTIALKQKTHGLLVDSRTHTTTRNIQITTPLKYTYFLLKTLPYCFFYLLLPPPTHIHTVLNSLQHFIQLKILTIFLPGPFKEELYSWDRCMGKTCK